MRYPRINLFLFFFLSGISSVYGQLQVSPTADAASYPSLSFMNRPLLLKTTLLDHNNLNQRPMGPVRPIAFTPPAFRAADLAFFCRLEYRIEQAARVPVRFRLGDVEMVDYLEGKRRSEE